MKNRILAAMIALIILMTSASPALARGKKWKDLLFGAFAGAGLGTAIGGALLTFYPTQKSGDAVWRQHFGYGAAAGLALGTTFGAIIGWKDVTPPESKVNVAPPAVTIIEPQPNSTDKKAPIVQINFFQGTF